MADEERHLAVAVAVDVDGRLLTERATRSALAVEFVDAWPQEALAEHLRARLGLSIPRSRMSATHLDLGGELYGHFMWLQLHPDEVQAFPRDAGEEVVWVTERELTDDPDLLAADPVRSEVLRLAFGWADAESTSSPAIPPKVDPGHVDWEDPFARAAALDAMADPEVDMLSGMVGGWEVTVGGGDDDTFMLTADGPTGVLNALGHAHDEREIDVRVGGQVLTLPSAYGLSRSDVEAALAELCEGHVHGPRWELDEG